MSYQTEHGLPVGYIVYKEHDGLSTFYAKHKRDLPKPNYPMPATIGFMQTKYGTYLFDTRDRFDGMPLFRGYTWEQWEVTI